MSSAIRSAFFAVGVCLCVAQSSARGQTQGTPPQEPSGAAAPAPPEFRPNDYLPLCSTEKVNGNCFFNIDRVNPISMPTFQMRRGAKITVYVFHPFAFEALTLDPGAAQAFEGSDQAAGLVNALAPIAKGGVFGTTQFFAARNIEILNKSLGLMEKLSPQLENLPSENPDKDLAREILAELQELNQQLTDTLAPLTSYFEETKAIYAAAREIESPAPRPVADLQAVNLRGYGIPSPWDHYADWRETLMSAIVKQGQHTTGLYAFLPVPCQKPADLANHQPADPPPPAGPWLPPARKCQAPYTATQPSATPLTIPPSFDSTYSELTDNLNNLPLDKPDHDTYQKIQTLKAQLDERHTQVARAIESYAVVLPVFITKASTDMQTLLTNIAAAPDAPRDPIEVGVIPSPVSAGRRDGGEKKVLAPYNQLAPQTVYTLNAQNEIANPLLGLPSATQKQALVTITMLYAEPRFEVSAGAFLSWLNNRTFSNVTDVTITNGTPAPSDVKLMETKTTRPLIIPFAAGNYRVSPEFTWPGWLGGRRGAIYGTLGVGLNPYNTQVEYFGGFSISWRYLMISPVYHLGHDTHLTQGEEVGQIWCQYGGGATATSMPPACAGAPPAPSTKTFWTGAFAVGISVRVPTTFSSTNH
jgi:hypothetical protein